jgi:hypothetical protein
MKSKGFVNIKDGVNEVSKGSTLVMKMARLAMVHPGGLRLAAGHPWLATAHCWRAVAGWRWLGQGCYCGT